MMLAEAVLPLPASAELTALVTLFCVPELMPETFTAKLQEPFAARVAPVRLTLADPAVAAIVPSAQFPVRPLGVATINPPGKASLKPTPLSDLPELGFDMVKVKVVEPFIGMLEAPNAFAIVGGRTCGAGALYDPPPHPAARTTAKAARAQFDTKPRFLGTLLNSSSG